MNHNEEEVRLALTKYKIALQQNKQTEIWIKLCKTIKEQFNGDIRNLFKLCNYDVNKIRNYIQVEHKKDFPYLSEDEFNKSEVQLIVIKRWNELLEGTEFCPIDIHTPLWLWSRNGFKEIKWN